MTEEYIKHYGIPGMKWGVQNGPPYPLTSKQKSKKELDPDYIKAHSRTPAKYLSTKDLTNINNRLNQERMYEEYLRSTSFGKRLVDSFVNMRAKEKQREITLIKTLSAVGTNKLLVDIGLPITAEIFDKFSYFVPGGRKK